MEVIITTGDIKNAYTILQPIFVQISNIGVLKNQFDLLELKHHEYLKVLQEKGVLTAETKTRKHGTLMLNEQKPDAIGFRMEKAFYIALEEMKQRATQINGQAIVYMRYETDFRSQTQGEFYLQMYGTVVQFT